MQSAMKEKACDILGPKKRRVDADSNGGRNKYSSAPFWRGGTSSRKRIYYKTAHQRVRGSPGHSKSKKLKRKAANVDRHIMEEHQIPRKQ